MEKYRGRFGFYTYHYQLKYWRFGFGFAKDEIYIMLGLIGFRIDWI